jgi:hypothetical protein
VKNVWGILGESGGCGGDGGGCGGGCGGDGGGGDGGGCGGDGGGCGGGMFRRRGAPPLPSVPEGVRAVHVMFTHILDLSGSEVPIPGGNWARYNTFLV